MFYLEFFQSHSVLVSPLCPSMSRDWLKSIILITEPNECAKV